MASTLASNCHVYDLTFVSDFNTYNSERQQDKQFKILDDQVTVHHDNFL